ncbi:MAG TPA: C45 family autoproteolytic acyltransferase/hydrolase [bacterium]|nr:C45 family autoproteolytic acyltransferase/hydrolase [bacterium]
MKFEKTKKIKRLVIFSLLFSPIIFVAFLLLLTSAEIPVEIKDQIIPVAVAEKIDGSLSGIKNNRFRHSQSGLYELYVEGSPIEIGRYEGVLTKELIVRQEEIFVDMLNRFVPGKYSRFMMKKFIYLFNKSMQKEISEEYLSEIFGISSVMEDDFAGLGNPYFRVLNYHAAHDIGHMMTNLNLVGCTAFSVKGEKSVDGDLITGRNFDFFIGDRFAKEKIISFIKPDNGFPFATVSWGGMTGVISGMNLRGLSITLNAAESEIPTDTATPVVLVAREMLQYADTIEKAYEIARSREIFVSQIFFVSSAIDNRSALIEKTPEKTELFYPESDESAVTNHFTGKLKGSEKHRNPESLRNSQKRLERVYELIEKEKPLNIEKTVKILRDTKGYGDKQVEPGSETAINQYVAHHSVVFNNTKKIMFISTSPWQFGEFRAYELEKVFNEFSKLRNDVEISDEELTIPADEFMKSEEFQRVKKSRDDGTFKKDDIRFSKDGLNM